MKLYLKIIIIFLILGIGVSLVLAVAVKSKQSKTVAQTASTGESFRALYSLANDQEAKGQMQEAKKTYERLLSDFPNNANISQAQKELENLNIKIIFSGIADSRNKMYEIRIGDTLDKIARQFNTTVDLLKKANALTSDFIQPGRSLKVYTGKFSCLVDKSQNTLTLKVDEDIIKTYTVSTGTNNSTPVGTFNIVNKLINPPWYKTGAIVPPESPENILGSRWMGLSIAGYGIHGTTEPQTIGRQVTSGCVRMLNADVEELYVLLPVGTEVTIVD